VTKVSDGPTGGILRPRAYCEDTVEGKRVEDDEPDLRNHPRFTNHWPGPISVARDSQQILRPSSVTRGQRFEGSWKTVPCPNSFRSENGSLLGLAVQRSDGSWRVTSFGSQVWEALALRRQAEIARNAPRGELDAARKPVRDMMNASGFSRLISVVAGQILDR